MRVYSEESFGPIVAIVTVDGIDEAVRVANDTEYGLSSAVFSRDLDAAMAVARRLKTGMCHINDATVNDEPQMPSAASSTVAGADSAARRHSQQRQSKDGRMLEGPDLFRRLLGKCLHIAFF